MSAARGAEERAAGAGSGEPGRAEAGKGEPLVVFTGIDGAGKSSLMARALDAGLFPGATAVKKEDKPLAAAVERYHRRTHGDHRDWIEGPYAHAMGLAALFEFLDHYRRNLEPLLEAGRPVVSDRYAVCYQGYLVSTGYPLPVADLLAGLRRPDLVVHVEVPIPVAVARYAERGGASEDESPEVMERFTAAYDRLLPELGCPVLRLGNDRPLEETCEELAAWLRQWRAGRSPGSAQASTDPPTAPLQDPVYRHRFP